MSGRPLSAVPAGGYKYQTAAGNKKSTSFLPMRFNRALQASRLKNRFS